MVHAIITSIYCVFLEWCLARNSTSTLITVGLVFSLFQHWVVSYEAIASTTELASTSAEIDEKFMKALLFVPCFVDGVWSNMRQITLYAYTTYQLSLKQHNKLSWIAPVLYFHKYNSSGDVAGIAGPVRFSTLFDINALSEYLHTVEEFNSTSAYVAANLTGTPFRCRSVQHFSRFKQFWGLDGASKTFYGESWLDFVDELDHWIGGQSEVSNFVVYGAPALPHSEDFSYWARMTAPFGNLSAVHYDLMSHGTRRSPYSEFVRKSLRFQLPIRQLAHRIIDNWNLGDDNWAAVHVRTGSGYPGDQRHMVTVREIVVALRAARDPDWRCARDVQTVVLSTTTDIDNIRIRKELISLVPGVHVRTFSEVVFEDAENASHDISWSIQEDVRDIMRDLAEMHVWSLAPVFIGCRSTMDEFVFLLRDDDDKRNCTLSSQPCFHVPNYSETHTSKCGNIRL